jgi:hypothetical protein
MIETVFGVIVDSGFQAIGWATLKAITLGRYQGFQPEDILVEGTLGFAVTAGLIYGAWRLMF